MLIRSPDRNEQADRTLARSAFQNRKFNRQFNVSIRADSGELANYTIDRAFRKDISIAIELPVKDMNNCNILKAMTRHEVECSGCISKWFAGVRATHRLHPWDEQILSFPTKAWLDCSADSGELAQEVARTLFSMGYEKSPMHIESPTAKHVFVYSLN
jgi:hypothetical protein